MTDTNNESPDFSGPEHNARGLFVGGPQFVSPSDVLAKLIDAARGKLTDEHYAPSPDAERKAHVRRKEREALRMREEGDDAPVARPPMRIYSRNLAQRIREQAA